MASLRRGRAPRRSWPLGAALALSLVAAACEDDYRVQRCDPGDSMACLCPGGDEATQVCTDDGMLPPCPCDGMPAPCDEGEVEACECLDGLPGERTCGSSGAFSACDCEPPPVDVPDAGGCEDPDADSDGDGLADCDELADGDSWTDPQVFNGLRATLATPCGAFFSCADLEDPDIVAECATDTAVFEELLQSDGWNYGSAASGSSCDPSYGFSPGFDSCASTFSVRWDGFIKLPAGTHCFYVSEGRLDGCGSVLVSTLPEADFPGWNAVRDADIVALHTRTDGSFGGGDLACDQFGAGIYPIRLFTQVEGPDRAYRVRHCQAVALECSPGDPLAAGLLRADPP